VAADEYGFDPDKSYTQEDNPFWDCTDGAHPAWWRGEKFGANELGRALKEWLDTPVDEVIKGSMNEPFHTLRQRIVDLRKQAEKLDN